MLREYGFRPEATYRYSTPPPGVNRLFCQETMYKLNRGFFGRLGAERNQWFGNDISRCFLGTPSGLILSAPLRSSKTT